MIRAVRHIRRNPWARLAIFATLAYLTYPITRWFARRGLPKWLGRTVTVIISTIEGLPDRLQAALGFLAVPVTALIVRYCHEDDSDPDWYEAGWEDAGA